ncbi:hypothetical protein E3N88_19851 [Mikania micrantha]|uniref:Reverse transcriptase Ty1/copia-type domain-containing protein n=1 Tax=Mikania micrantha TaxID=192012 RepID=A0A5N6NRS4_9ASTR|nr:hypothetical protein E3N88_19851 [Mikania micrantha]
MSGYDEVLAYSWELRLGRLVIEDYWIYWMTGLLMLDAGLDYIARPPSGRLLARLETVRLVLALSAQNGWPVHHLDVKTTFLHGELNEEVKGNHGDDVHRTLKHFANKSPKLRFQIMAIFSVADGKDGEVRSQFPMMAGVVSGVMVAKRSYGRKPPSKTFVPDSGTKSHRTQVIREPDRIQRPFQIKVIFVRLDDYSCTWRKLASPVDEIASEDEETRNPISEIATTPGAACRFPSREFKLGILTVVPFPDFQTSV